MKKDINPKITAILNGQKTSALVNAVISVIVTTYISTNYVPADLLGFFFTFVFSGFLYYTLNTLTTHYLIIKNYGLNYDEMKKDTQQAIDEYNRQLNGEVEQPVATEAVLKIVKTPEKHVGTYLDSLFFEWLDVEGSDGKVHRFTFFSTMDLSKGITREIPDDCFILPPGIIYKKDE